MTAADVAIAFALAQRGKPYRWATAGPDTYDCSGLTYASYRSAGVKIGRVTYTQINDGVGVAKADLLPGDLVFPEPTHVQLYIGNGMIVESPHTGAVVRVAKLSMFWRARRVAEPGTSAAGSPMSSTSTSGIVTVKNPLDLIPGVSTFEAIGKVLSDVNFWRRTGMFALGVLIVLIAFAFINRGRIESAAKNAEKVGEVAALV